MDLSELSATELQKLDAVCLDYEADLRAGVARSIDAIVGQYDSKHSDLLRRELEAVQEELAASELPADTVFGTGKEVLTEDGLPVAGGQLGPYTIDRLIDRGGMGAVFLAVDRRLNRRVAIKMLAIKGGQHQMLRERFAREAKAVAAISHPNVVELFDVGEAYSLPYAVMELLEGQTLDRFLAKTRLSVQEVRDLGIQIADALTVAHANGVIHRDLKPHNVMVMQRNGSTIGLLDSAQSHSSANGNSAGITIKLFDFGLSRAEGALFDDSTDDRTREGVVMGTPGYMAPEQARGEQVGPLADIFSLGCILYEAFYSRRAFDGETSSARFASTLETTPKPDPLRQRDDMKLAELIQKCIEKDPRNRPASVAEIAVQLRQPQLRQPMEQAGSTPPAVASEPTKSRLTRRRVLELVGAGAVGLVAAGILFRDSQETIRGVNSLGVLSFADSVNRGAVAPEPSLALLSQGQPIGVKNIPPGDQFAALLVNELSRLRDVSVTPFRPLIAETPEEFKAIGKKLEVDALVSGTFQTVSQGNKQFDMIDLRIVSAKTGNQLWGQSFVSGASESLLQQSRFASEIATAIGRSLTSSDKELSPQNFSAFSCLVQGSARSDLDSAEGLREALRCFQSAHDQDVRFAAPLSGMALTSITLAAQSDSEDAVRLVQQARAAASEAIALNPDSVDARLAEAMLMWQTMYQYDEAHAVLSQLRNEAPNHWQIRHQLGLLEMTLGNHDQSLKRLREAAQLNPMSVIAMLDVARAHWFAGNTQRAVTDAMLIRDLHGENRFARGLLIDLYEHLGQFDAAAAEHIGIDFGETAGAELSATAYFRRRSELDLKTYPYGPFGSLLNQAILQSRIDGGVDDTQLGKLTAATSPMLPLLLSAHPCFASARVLERAAEILPTSGSSDR